MLELVDLKLRLARAEYESQLKPLQSQLHLLGYQVYAQKRPVVIVFEGWDAAGKGGAIKRLTATLDPRYYQVYPISAPSPEEKDKHFLWRFWNKLPGSHEIHIWDRSH